MIKSRGQTILIVQLRVSPKNIKRLRFSELGMAGGKIEADKPAAIRLRLVCGRNCQNPFGSRFIIAFDPFVTKIKMPAVFDDRRADLSP